MTNQDTGGPAYPTYRLTSTPEPGGFDLSLERVAGMTLLDYFAAQATDNDIRAHAKYRSSWGHSRARPERTRVEARYCFAEAMLAEKRRREAAQEET